MKSGKNIVVGCHLFAERGT